MEHLKAPRHANFLVLKIWRFRVAKLPNQRKSKTKTEISSAVRIGLSEGTGIWEIEED